MIRAAFYTACICAVSAGAAVSLALVHDAGRTIDIAQATTSDVGIDPAAPVTALTTAPVAVAVVPVQPPVAATQNVQPTLVAPMEVSLPSVTDMDGLDEPSITVAPQSLPADVGADVTFRANQDDGGSTDASVAPDFDGPAEDRLTERKRVVRIQREPVARKLSIGDTWATGVYR